LYDIGSYAIHAIRNVLGQEPETVQVEAVKDAADIDTAAYAYYTFADGTKATFDTRLDLADRKEYEVAGTKGSIKVPSAYHLERNCGVDLVIVETQGVSRTETLNTDQYRDQVEHISRAILNGDRKLHNDYENTLANMRVIDACMEAMETGERV